MTHAAERLVVSVVGRKGGAGKTTTAFNLAGVFVEMKRPVQIIDLDPQQSLSRLVERQGERDLVQALGAQAEEHVSLGDVGTWLARILPREGSIIIDTPPYLGAIMDAAIAVADRVLLPTRLAQQDIDSLLDTLTRCPDTALIVPNAVATRRRGQRETIAELRRIYGAQVSAGEIPDSVLVEDALNAGTYVVRYARRSGPSNAYRALAVEVSC